MIPDVHNLTTFVEPACPDSFSPAKPAFIDAQIKMRPVDECVCAQPEDVSLPIKTITLPPNKRKPDWFLITFFCMAGYILFDLVD